MLKYLSKDNETMERPPSLSHNMCYFGKRYHGIGTELYVKLIEFKNIGVIHKQIHDLAKQLCDLKNSDNYDLLSQ